MQILPLRISRKRKLYIKGNFGGWMVGNVTKTLTSKIFVLVEIQVYLHHNALCCNAVQHIVVPSKLSNQNQLSQFVVIK